MSWMYRARAATQRVATDEEGQTMAEYGLILAGIAVVVVAAVGLLGGAIDQTFRGLLASF